MMLIQQILDAAKFILRMEMTCVHTHRQGREHKGRGHMEGFPSLVSSRLLHRGACRFFNQELDAFSREQVAARSAAEREWGYVQQADMAVSRRLLPDRL